MNKGQAGLLWIFCKATHYGKLWVNTTSHRAITRVQAITNTMGFLMESYYIKFNDSKDPIITSSFCCLKKIKKGQMQ